VPPLAFAMLVQPMRLPPNPPAPAGRITARATLRYAPVLAAKKADLARSYAAKLVALLDHDGQCVARVEQAPDRFPIRTIPPDGGSAQSFAWDADEERIALNQLAAGTLGTIYLLNEARRSSCCQEPSYDKQPDTPRPTSILRR
jgi:hypothetical protein